MRLQKDSDAHLERSKWKPETLRVCISQLSHLLCQHTPYKLPRHSISNVQCCSTEISRGYDFSSSRNCVLSRRRCGPETKVYVAKITRKLMSNFKQELHDKLDLCPSVPHVIEKHTKIQLMDFVFDQFSYLFLSLTLQQFNSLVIKEPGVLGLSYCGQLFPVGLTLMIIKSSSPHFFQL